MLWPTRLAVPANSRKRRAASRGAGAPATSASVMPCIWAPKIGAAGVHEGREAIDDLAVADAHGADLDQVRNLGIAAGGLDVDDDELGAALGDLLDEVEDGAGAGLEVADDLGLADGGAHLILDVDERLQGAVAEEDRVGHHVFGDDRGAGLDHHDRVAGARDDEVDVGVLEVTDSLG